MVQCCLWVWNPAAAYIQTPSNLLKPKYGGQYCKYHQNKGYSYGGKKNVNLFHAERLNSFLRNQNEIESKKGLNREWFPYTKGRTTKLYMTSGAEPQKRRSSFLRNPFQRRKLVDNENKEDDLYDKIRGRTVTFVAEKFGEAPVKEGLRSLKDYLALPPSEYSVLDPECVERIGDDSFRCEISGLNFFGVRMIPILYVKVIVEPLHAKSTLDIYKLELKGSQVAEKANGTFDIKAKNVVSYRADSIKGNMLSSKVSVEVNALVPRSNLMPSRVMERSGSYIIQGVLNVMVPTFIKVLAKDYQRWATGNDDRAPALLEAGLSKGMKLIDDSGNIDDRLNR